MVTFGRNGKDESLLVSKDRLSQLGIDFHETDRGGDVTYHGPGQLVCYPVMDLKRWKRDVGAYLRALEEVLILTLADYGLEGRRDPTATGVWVGDAKVAAMGVHLSRWITSHGFALNVTTDLDYFRYIVPCGLTRPVTSMEQLLLGPLADAMTHAGQLAMLRRLAGSPIAAENFMRADIRI